MTEMEIKAAIHNSTPLKDFDGEIGVPIKVEWGGHENETLMVTLVGENFRRGSDALDLSPA